MPTALRGFRAVTCAGLVAVAIGAPLAADAQVLYGSIVGNVTDSTGSSMPGATVTIEQTETKLKRELVTDIAGAYQLHRGPDRNLHHHGHDGRVPRVRPAGRSGLAQLGGARGCEARGRAAHRGRQRDVGDADAPDRSGRGPVGAEGRRAHQPAGADRPQLPAALQDASRLHAAGRRALDSVESVARAGLQRQRRQPQLEQHAHRRRQHDEHLAAARRRLRPRARIARGRQRRHQQLRRRAGAGGRLGDQRADQERHEPVEGLRVRVPHERADARAQTYFQPPGTPKGDWAYHQFGGDARRTDPAEQAVLLRQLREHARQAERHAHDLGTHGRIAKRRPLGVCDHRSTTR